MYHSRLESYVDKLKASKGHSTRTAIQHSQSKYAVWIMIIIRNMQTDKVGSHTDTPIIGGVKLTQRQLPWRSLQGHIIQNFQ